MRSPFRAGLLAALVVLSLAFIPPGNCEVEPDALSSGIGRFMSILCEDVDSDGRMEILFGSYDGYVVSVEYYAGDYSVDWTSPRYGTRVWGLETGQFDQDDDLEIAIGDGDGQVRVLDGRTKRVEWESVTLVRDAHGILFHDLDGDGQNELVVGTGFKTDQGWGQIYFFKPNSSEPYDTLPPFDSRLRELDVADVDNDGKEELIVCSGVSLGDIGGEGYIRIFDLETGKLEWKSPDLFGCIEGLRIVDLDGDGTKEIIVSNGYRYREGWCYIFTYDGADYRRIWRSENLGPKAYGLDIADIDGDEILEIVVSNMDGYIRVYDGITHQLEWRSPDLGRDILGLTIADPDQDGQLEIIAGQGGYNGKGDFTSGYVAPHVYVIDGRTKEIEEVMGDVDEVLQWFKVATFALIALMLVQVAILSRLWVHHMRRRRATG
ncbi:MAG: VCBS repeat-containing protein [Candidatus Thermoplasmatota archaeon]|nr:VCBS repeat-containing protein [Candidatus Thermoplasmatota archaeon]